MLLISDLHGNIDAVAALDAAVRGEAFDKVMVLGDLVDYGAAPGEVIDWVRRRSDHTVRGNHDHAMATGADCRSSPAFKGLSVATRKYFRGRLDRPSIDFLGGLPSRLMVQLGRRAAWLLHATPRDPLFEYLAGDAPESAWREALAALLGPAAFLFLGHTHLPFARTVGATTIVNPGSLGQPKDGDPRGCYAVVEDGTVQLRRVAYDVERAVARLESAGLDRGVAGALARILRTGGQHT